MADRESGGARLVYGELEESLVFLAQEEAVKLARLHEALQTSTTWSEFKTKVSQDVYEETLELLDEEGPEPDPESDFLAGRIPGYEEGDWPSWPAQDMLHWIPKDVQERFGSAEPSAISGDSLLLPPEKEDEIVSAMEAHGYACSSNDTLDTVGLFNRGPSKRVPEPISRLQWMQIWPFSACQTNKPTVSNPRLDRLANGRLLPWSSSRRPTNSCRRNGSGAGRFFSSR